MLGWQNFLNREFIFRVWFRTYLVYLDSGTNSERLCASLVWDFQNKKLLLSKNFRENFITNRKRAEFDFPLVSQRTVNLKVYWCIFCLNMLILWSQFIKLTQSFNIQRLQAVYKNAKAPSWIMLYIVYRYWRSSLKHCT